MQKWPIGVFTSVDAGLGVRLDVAQELGIPTVQMVGRFLPRFEVYTWPATASI